MTRTDRCPISRSVGLLLPRVGRVLHKLWRGARPDSLLSNIREWWYKAAGYSIPTRKETHIHATRMRGL